MRPAVLYNVVLDAILLRHRPDVIRPLMYRTRLEDESEEEATARWARAGVRGGVGERRERGCAAFLRSLERGGARPAARGIGCDISHCILSPLPLHTAPCRPVAWQEAMAVSFEQAQQLVAPYQEYQARMQELRNQTRASFDTLRRVQQAGCRARQPGRCAGAGLRVVGLCDAPAAPR